MEHLWCYAAETTDDQTNRQTDIQTDRQTSLLLNVPLAAYAYP